MDTEENDQAGADRTQHLFPRRHHGPADPLNYRPHLTPSSAGAAGGLPIQIACGCRRWRAEPFPPVSCSRSREIPGAEWSGQAGKVKRDIGMTNLNENEEAAGRDLMI